MKSSKHSSLTRIFRLSLGLALLLMASSAAADEAWHLRAGATWVDADVRDSQFASDDLDTDSGVGAQITLERRLAPWIGLEIGVLYGMVDFSQAATRPDGLTFINESEVRFPTLTVALNVHGPSHWPVDLYIGPLYSYLDFDDVTVKAFVREGGAVTPISTFDREAAGTYAWGVQVGGDLRLSDSPWGVHASVRYLDASLETFFAARQQAEFDFDPLIFSTGLSFRF